jgi:hypothetical protein
MPNLAPRLLFAAMLAATAPTSAADPAAPRVPALLAALDAGRDGRLTQGEMMHAARERQVAGSTATAPAGSRPRSTRPGGSRRRGRDSRGSSAPTTATRTGA